MGRVSRRSQIAELNRGENVVCKKTTKVYRTAIYARISVEKKESVPIGDSICTQIFFMKQYIEKRPELSLTATFTDSGYTGTNFQRPGFEKMMEEIRDGKIDCVIVKDFSRFGRNYIEAGRYIETVLPFFSVRFIAINDNYDSINPMDSNKYFSVSIKNLTNELMARDIAKKVQSVLKAKQKNGEFIGSRPAYGYLKSPEDRHKLIVDPETAPIVFRIFKMRDEGMSYKKIAELLDLEGIESPERYSIRIGRKKPSNSAKQLLWNYTQIRKILQNPVYIGHMAQGKYSNSKLDGRKTVCHSKEDWIVVENTHEPIVPMDLWDSVQRSFEKSQEYYNNHFARSGKTSENILKGKLICGDCGYSMVRNTHHCKNEQKYCVYYCCHKDKNGQSCPTKFIQEKKLLEAIYKIVRVQINLCMDYKKIIAELESKKSVNHYGDTLNDEREKTLKLRNDIMNKKALLYDEYAGNSISREDYMLLCSGYDQDIKRFTNRINEIEERISNQKVMLSAENDWIIAFDKFRSRRKLSKDMVDALIKKIIVKSKTEIEIEFYYKDEFDKLSEGLNKLQMEVQLNG